MPSEIEKSYAAGLFDGEGHICISYSSGRLNSYKNKYPRYQMRVIVGQNSKIAVKWLFNRYGGSLKRYTHKRSYGDKLPYGRWDWILSTNGAVIFLRDILPYLLLKKDEAELAISFQESMMITGRQKLSDNVIEFRKNCFIKIRELRKAKNAVDR